MTKKRIILIFVMFMLVIIPVSATEIPFQAPTQEQVLATATVTPKSAVVKPVAKPVVKKPVAKKPVAKKKAPAKKKERLITAPPLITVETAPHSGKR